MEFAAAAHRAALSDEKSFDFQIHLTAYFGDGLVTFCPTIVAKLTDNPGNVSLRDSGVLAVRPEALGVKLLERASREFEAALLECLSLFHEAHSNES